MRDLESISSIDVGETHAISRDRLRAIHW
jgi:hypothetical protein